MQILSQFSHTYKLLSPYMTSLICIVGNLVGALDIPDC